MLKTLIIAALALFMAVPATQADELDILCCTHHFLRDRGFNENNLGVIYKYNIYNNIHIGIGRYHNSENTYSNLIGIENRWKINNTLSFKLPAGIVTGYRDGDRFFVLPTLTLYDRINFSLIPITEGGISMSITAIRW